MRMRSRAIRLGIAAALVLPLVVTVTTHSASAATTTFTATADAQVREASATTNYGTTTGLRVDAGSGPDIETYLRFGVAGLSGAVQSATLRLFVTSSTANGPAVYTTANTWVENTITWSNRTARVGTGVDDKASVSSGAWVDFDVTSLVGGDGTYNFVLAGTSTDGIDFDSREATNKPQLVVTTATATDNENPTDPTGLSATAISATRIDLSWTAATDNVGVTGYEIYREGTLLTTVGNVTTFPDTGLAPSTLYRYEVKAKDAAGNTSGLSNTASATTLDDLIAPSAPTNLSATAINANRIDLSWTAATDNVAVTNYEIYRDTVLLTTIGALTSYSDTDVAADTSYSYTVRALDAAGNDSLDSNTANVTTLDTQDPTPPTDLTATAISGTRIDLSWTAATDNVGVTGYEIYRGGSPLTTLGNVTTYSDLSVVNGTGYTYQVRALDAAGNDSLASNTASATTPDTQDPAPPTNLTATMFSMTRVDLSWTAATDNVAVTGYEIFRGGSLLTTVGSVTAYSDMTVLAGTTYSYQVRALDAANHRSTFSNTATVEVTDAQAPTAPTNLAQTAVAYNRVDLSWTASTDNVAVTNYEIYRGGVLVGTVGAVTTYADTTVAPGITYAYQVKARDLAGNRSGFSNTLNTTTPQQVVTLTPVADAKVQEANPTTNYGTATALRVDAGSSSDVESYLMFSASGLAGSLRHATLRVWASSGTVDGPAVFTSGTSWTETTINWSNRPGPTSIATDDKAGISTGTWVEYDVTTLVNGNGTWAFLLAGTSSDGLDMHSKEGVNDPQLVITMGAPDTQAPSAPTSLVASAPSPTQVDLSWNPSTDDVAVMGYNVYRGGTLVASIGSVTTFSDTTVTGNRSYSYTVKARDKVPNLSSASNTANVTTPSSGGSSPVIAAAGDIACADSDADYNSGLGTSTACRQLYTSNLLVGGGYSAVLPLGDNQYNSGSLSQFNAVYDPTWGRVKSISRPVVGNHEYGTSGASGHFTYYGSLAGDPSKGYYSYDVGAWHLIALNSNCTRVACDVGSAQEQWLRSDLSAHPAACTLAYTHHARWSSGHDGDNVFVQPLWQALYDGGAELLLSGHSHNYERFAPQNATGGADNASGIRQFVVGTGGAFFTGVGSAHPNSQVRNNNTFGILKLTLRSTGYDWQFVPEAGATFADSGSTACH